VRLRSTTALLACVVLVAACSGNSKPQVLPTLRPTPSATVAPVAIPSPARVRSPQGAEAFIRFFFVQLNQAFASSNADLIKAHSNSECGTCRTYEAALTASKRDGHFIRGDSFGVSNVAVPPLQSLGTIAEVSGRTPARTVVDAAGATVEVLKDDGAFHLQVAVKWSGQRWVVSGIRLAK
jgi:hypothetical protein